MKLDVEDRGNYLRVQVSDGNRSFANLRTYWSAVVKGLQARVERRVLVVEDLSGMPELHEVRELVSGVLLPHMAGARLAFVIPNPGSVQILEFAEFLMRQAGVVADQFRDEAAAVEWLCGDVQRAGPD